MAHPPSARTAAQRHQLSRHEREQHYQRLSLIGAGIIVLVVAVLLGVGWYQSYVQPFHQTVVTVGSMRADMTFLIKQLKQILPQFGTSDPQVIVNSAPNEAGSEIVQQFLLLQRASAFGVTATDQEVDEALAQQLGVVSVNGSTPDRVALEAGLRSKLGSTGLTLAEYRQQVRALLLRDKLRAKLVAELPKVGPAVSYSEMLLSKQDDAKSILSRLNNGESWDAISAQVRANPSMGAALQHEFEPKIGIDEKFAGPLFALSNGQHTEVLPTDDGRYAIELLVAKDDEHAFSEDQLSQLGPTLLTKWMIDQKSATPTKVSLSDEQKVFALKNSDWHPTPVSSGPAQPPNAAPVAPPGAVPAVPAQAPGLENLPPGVATPAGGLVAPTIPASSGTPAR